MSCTGPNALNPVCHLNDLATSAANDAFSNIAGWFGKAASQATTWLWGEIGSATSVNLHSPQLGTDLLATSAIAVVLCLGLFLVQVIASELLLVISLMIGVSVIGGAGISAQPGPRQQLTRLAPGSLILLLGGFA